MHEPKGNPRLKPWLDRLLAAGYPYVYPHNILGDGYLFFHSEKEKQDYINLMEGVQINSTEYVRNLGHVLGFPTNSISFFTDMWQMEEEGKNVDHLENQTIGVNMSGIMFSAHIPHLMEDISWMWQRYNQTEAKQYPTIFDTTDEKTIIKHGDYTHLEILHQQLEWALW
ncbi:hypothetical protein [Shimazuella kribbensis]|uniref:hypothetical protein n=1 Tax=Shimazuella kribbensis TaxID=139808 RepID=UPI0003FF1A98|nr:hypothetical protein [Shimazuella kribbensis]